MKILIIGGTGAMGAPLTQILGKNEENTVYVLARKKMYVPEMKNVQFIKGDAFDLNGMSDLVRREKFDVIVDFMIYNVENYKGFIDTYMSSCKQYVFTSTSSVYDEPPENSKITEETDRLYDKYNEERKNNNNVYHILKSNLDNIIFESEFKNWTMVRPYVTFNTKRLPLVTWPKEGWLYRVVKGKKVVLPKDAMFVPTTITYGAEVANGISFLIGNNKAFGQIVNIASNISTTWDDVLKIYQPILNDVCGKTIDIFWVEKAEEIWEEVPHQYDFYACDRLLRKEFDTTKLDVIAGKHIEFTDVRDSLAHCIKDLFSESNYQIVPDPILNGYMDKITKEHTHLSEFKGWRRKKNYLINRYRFLNGIYVLLRKIKKLFK